ncbi:hypothetical protein Q9292_08255 [Methylophilus sp. VKM B-3414]|uniref:hypothetical protein n=1 Tax=Methylophilus sp. VKM B-3414 TaxID=3076121 RepID=UPI0028C51C8B|nr:hypothetical protein [Methylophilus sp. VKM B-3414]MDT7849597.1 hypothetical protein [Methylophilus sp. VKM B-3414]
MAREFEVRILITLDSEDFDSRVILNKNVEYPFSKVYKDRFHITNQQIEITALRSQKVDIDSIFSNYNSALNKQVTKALTYYYCSVCAPIKIRQIQISQSNIRNKGKFTPIKKIIGHKDIYQIIEKNSSLVDLCKIKSNELEAILNEDSKGHAILIATTHLIKACCLSNPFDKFDKLWRSFNALYKCLAQKTKDSECLIHLRKHMDANNALYPLSQGLISSTQSNEIRDNIRWIAMIHNDFPTEKQAEAFKGFVLQIKDSRFISIVNDALSVRKTHLINRGFWNQVENHIKINLASPKKYDTDVVAILCLRYMYFVRNKSFHAEKLDSSFNIVANNKEEKELIWLCKILKFLIIDVINFNSKF